MRLAERRAEILERPQGEGILKRRASILKELDKKGYAEVIGGSCGINIDMVNIVGAVGALIQAHALHCHSNTDWQHERHS